MWDSGSLHTVQSWLFVEPCRLALRVVGAAGRDGAGLWGDHSLVREGGSEEGPALRAGHAGLPSPCASFRKNKVLFKPEKSHQQSPLFADQALLSSALPHLARVQELLKSKAGEPGILRVRPGLSLWEAQPSP